MPEQIGIVVVHGVMPHPRYEIQDECAGSLTGALNADPQWKKLGCWEYSVVNPVDPSVLSDLDPRPTISRVRLQGDNPVAPANTYFDVIEAYWSPLDKGKATFARVAGWLLQTIFVPLNTTARYMASPAKTFCDFGLIGGGIVLVVAFLALALLMAVKSLAQLTHTSESQSFATLIKTLTTFDFSGFPDESMLVKFALAVAGAYLIVQAVKGLIGFFQQLQTQKKIPAQMWDRLRFIVIVAVIGAALFVPMGWAYKGTGLLLVVAALAFEGGRTIAQSFFVNFFGDVQIYTTRDENVDYNAMRDKILELVTTTIVRVSSDDANGGKGYDKVFILAHSLGATVTLDAIMRYHQFIEQAPPVAKDLLVRAFRRIRALVTFGCPLEKTKYFTDVQNPSPSLALDQWRSDAYGPLFTDQPAELLASNAAASAMFWANYWYFADAVANEMESYRSFVPAGANAALGHHLRRTMHDLGPGKKPLGRPLCRNERGHKWWSLPDVIPHGDYLLDDWFWHSSVDPDPKKSHLGVLDIVARTGASPAPAAFGGRTWQQAPPSGPGYAVGPTYEPATPGQAAKFHDFRP